PLLNVIHGLLDESRGKRNGSDLEFARGNSTLEQAVNDFDSGLGVDAINVARDRIAGKILHELGASCRKGLFDVVEVIDESLFEGGSCREFWSCSQAKFFKVAH